LSGHNPVKQLRQISPDRLDAAANDPGFLALYELVISAFDTDMANSNTWFAATYPDRLSGPIAYFSAEFAIHNSLPVYAGGLGVLAGDTCKEASDLGLPLVAVGFMYPQGYFHQHISTDGWQEEIYRQLDFNEAPVKPIFSPRGYRALTEVQLADRALYIGAWQVRLGRVNLYLLDTHIEGNEPQDQQLSARLYTADREERIQQEIVLGIGGVRVLRALGIKPSVWHANEGHTAFMMLERIREEIEQGVPFAQAVRRVQASTIFTTHTPVPAGSDIFSAQLVEKYFRDYWGYLGIDQKTFLELGQLDGSETPAFNMTVLALRMVERRNAVSRLHGVVSRKMWQGLWPDVKEEEVPISSITNGVHVPTWVAPELLCLYQGYLGQDLVKRLDAPEIWQRVMEIPDERIWAVHQLLKRKLISAMVERTRECSVDRELTAQQMLAMGAFLDPEVLTIGFVRRFTEYKRPALILRDVERLKRIVNHQWQPVQIIFAGKSHPADFPSKYLLHQVYTMTLDRDFRGRIAFVEDYDIHMAHYLVQGVDLWLNTPRRLREACGTSGMKAMLNGVLHLSVRDGWWHEGYNGANGWAIGRNTGAVDPGEEDELDAEALYHLLEEEIVPLYYDRDRSGVPHGWIHKVKEAIRTVVPIFCTRRMLKAYTEQLYIPEAQSLRGIDQAR